MPGLNDASPAAHTDDGINAIAVVDVGAQQLLLEQIVVCLLEFNRSAGRGYIFGRRAARRFARTAIVAKNPLRDRADLSNLETTAGTGVCYSRSFLLHCGTAHGNRGLYTIPTSGGNGWKARNAHDNLDYQPHIEIQADKLPGAQALKPSSNKADDYD